MTLLGQQTEALAVVGDGSAGAVALREGLGDQHVREQLVGVERDRRDELSELLAGEGGQGARLGAPRLLHARRGRAARGRHRALALGNVLLRREGDHAEQASAAIQDGMGGLPRGIRIRPTVAPACRWTQSAFALPPPIPRLDNAPGGRSR